MQDTVFLWSCHVSVILQISQTENKEKQQILFTFSYSLLLLNGGETLFEGYLHSAFGTKLVNKLVQWKIWIKWEMW